MNTNYVEKYLNYYTGENRKSMYLCFAKLVDAIRSDDYSLIHEVCTDDCIADFSTCGHAEGINNIIDMLKWPGPDCNIRKSTIWNFVARSNNDGIGQQSAYIQSIMAIDDGINVHPFTFGGQYCNSFVKTEQGWRINHIRFDLTYADGNNGFVMGKWALICPELYSGHKPMIIAELDAPWYVIPEDCEPQSDVEQIFEIQFKKTFGFDRGEFHLPLDVATDDMWQFTEEKGKRPYVNFLKYIQHKEANLQHANRMGSCIIDGDYAIAFMPRGEEHRLRDKVYNRENIHSMVTTSAHKLYAKKIDGVWKLYKLESGFVPSEKMKFIPIEDDVIAYDEYVIGDICDEKEYTG